MNRITKAAPIVRITEGGRGGGALSPEATSGVRGVLRQLHRLGETSAVAAEPRITATLGRARDLRYHLGGFFPAEAFRKFNSVVLVRPGGQIPVDGEFLFCPK